jgi:hypothetical protein
MDIDFSSLAARIAADIQDLRGCVIVSRDGLVLGSHPTEAENILKPAWLRFASLGDVEKGFIQFSGELWVYVRRGPYASFAVSSSLSRPGLLLDQLEQVLLAAEEARGSGQGGPGGGGLPGSRPRTSLHPEARPSVTSSAQSRAESTASDEGFAELSAISQSEGAGDGSGDDASVGVNQAPAAPTAAAQAPPQAAAQAPPQAAAQAPPQAVPQAQPPSPPAPVQDLDPLYSTSAQAGPAPGPDEEGVSEESEESGDVDRIALAQEFAQLLGESGYDEREDD